MPSPKTVFDKISQKRVTIANRTYGTHQSLYLVYIYFPIFTNNIGPIYHSKQDLLQTRERTWYVSIYISFLPPIFGPIYCGPP